MHRRSHGKIQRSGWNFQKKVNLRLFPERFLQAEKDAAGRKVFGERFIIVAVGEQSYPKVKRVANCAPCRAPVEGTRRRTNRSFHERVS
jgi:hypothetical protein